MRRTESFRAAGRARAAETFGTAVLGARAMKTFGIAVFETRAMKRTRAEIGARRHRRRRRPEITRFLRGEFLTRRQRILVDQAMQFSAAAAGGGIDRASVFAKRAVFQFFVLHSINLPFTGNLLCVSVPYYRQYNRFDLICQGT